MKNIMLNKEEINHFKTIGERIDKAMMLRGVQNISELNTAIKKKRGNSPDRSIYSKMKTPPRPEQEYYNISAENLYVIADILEVSTDYLLGKEDLDKHIEVSDITELGLSSTAIENLKKIKEKAINYDADKIISTSKYYLNPYDKKLTALNWILEHISFVEDTEIEQMDFLMSLYYSIMTSFKGYRGGMTELVFNSIDTYNDKRTYQNALFQAQNPSNCDKKEHTENVMQKTRQELYKYRKQYVKNESWNRKRREVVKSYLENGVASIMEPLTYDEVRIPLGDPQNAISEHLNKIIKQWHAEYKPTYNKMVAKKNDEYNTSFKPLKKDFDQYPEDIDSAYLNVDTYESSISEELQYREPYLRELTEDEMKLYMMLEYIEGTDLEFNNLSDSGELDLSGKNISKKKMDEVVMQADQNGTGIYVNFNGKYMYDEKRAVSTYERLKNIYETEILPRYLEMWLANPGDFTGIGYVTNEFRFNYTKEVIAELKHKVKDAGGKYIVKNGYVKIFKK